MNLIEKISYLQSLPQEKKPDAIYETLSKWVTSRNINLYPEQEEAILEIIMQSNIILATPTGSGKSLVAIAAHFIALAFQDNNKDSPKKIYYTAPIKALVSEKFFNLCEIFGANNVGMLTGDSAVNPQAPIICCTAEILANIALREGELSNISQIVMDEFHFYSDPQRGWAWQIPIIELPQAQFILMSATLGDTSFFEKDLQTRTGKITKTITTDKRPIPLEYGYKTTSLQETLIDILNTQKAPVYVVYFSQAEASAAAQNFMSLKVVSKEDKIKIATKIGDFKFASGFGKVFSRIIRQGIGIHHAGMLPKYRRLVEQLAQEGLLKIICGTDTLGVGVNIPIRTVLFTALSKFDGNKSRILNSREFHQISGRAGRAGFDTSGNVIVQAPEYVIENLKSIEKASSDPKKVRKISKKKPPAGSISWRENTFDKLVNSIPEPLNSSFRISHAILLNLLERPGNTFEHAKKLLTNNHENSNKKRKMILRSLEIYRSLLNAGIIEKLIDENSKTFTIRLAVDLPDNFTLNQPLATFALASLELLDSQNPDYALDVISIIESILEDPKQVLGAQLFREKREKIAQLKNDGVDYNERMALLEEITYPKPLENFLYDAFDIYQQGAPWVSDYRLSPKSVVRDLWENAMNFSQFIQFYGLVRSEGLVLRYFSDAYKALNNMIPQEFMNTEIEDFTSWLGVLVRGVDSSLIDEWESLTHPKLLDERISIDIPKRGNNYKAWEILFRNEMFRIIQLLSRENYNLLAEVSTVDGWSARDWEEMFYDYWSEYDYVIIDANARSSQFFTIEKNSERWVARQIVLDPMNNCDWVMVGVANISNIDEDDIPELKIMSLIKI